MSDDVAADLRALRGRGVARVVLLVARVDDRDLLAAVEAGASGRDPAQRGDRGQHGRRRSGPPPPARARSRRTCSGRLLRQVGQLQRQVLAPRGLTFSGLTERETAVLRLLAQGHDTAEVGRQLFYSERTVKNIIHDVTSRLELRNRAHAVAYAIREGLI